MVVLTSWDVIPALNATRASRCASRIAALALPRGTSSSVGSVRRITILPNCAPTLAYGRERFRPLPRDAAPLALNSGPIFLITPEGVCKVDVDVAVVVVVAVVVADGVDVVANPEAVDCVEALNSRSTSLATFCWFSIANSACNP